MKRSSGNDTRRRLSKWRAVSLAAALLLGGCGQEDPPNWQTVFEAAPRVGPPGAPGPGPATTSHVVIYLDTSASMAGYVAKDRRGQTVFSRTLQELRNLTSLLNPPMDVLVRYVDTHVGAPLNDSALSEASVTPMLFAGRETDLAGALGELAQPVAAALVTTSAGAAAPEQPQPPARFHLLITDGVQSIDQQRPRFSCVAGSDQVCVRKRILELLNQGWGATVIGMRSEFDGRIFSEVGHTTISYQSRPEDAATFRPFYIYLFSPDRAALDGLARVLRERLRLVVGRDDAIRELALTSTYAEGFARSAATPPKGEARALELSRAREESPARLTLRVDVDTEASGAENFQLTAEVPWSDRVRYAGTPREMAELVSWKLVPVYHTGQSGGKADGWRYPELRIVGQEVDAEGRAQLQVAAQWPRGTGDLGWRVYRLEGRLNLEQQTPAWVRQWSTNLDTTGEAASKTLNLESVLLGLWRNDVLRDQAVAESYIRVGPR